MDIQYDSYLGCLPILAAIKKRTVKQQAQTVRLLQKHLEFAVDQAPEHEFKKPATSFGFLTRESPLRNGSPQSPSHQCRKRGNSHQMQNYRGITPDVPIAAKCLQSDDLRPYLQRYNRKLRTNQAGFRRGMSCKEQINKIRRIMEEASM